MYPCPPYYIGLSLALAGLIALLYLVHNSRVISDFFVEVDFFGLYYKIAQRMCTRLHPPQKLETLLREQKNMPIREVIRSFEHMFEEDFAVAFGNLKPNRRYRIVTHSTYANLIEQAEREGKIRFLKEKKFVVKRTLREVKPLVGAKDYRLLKKCVSGNPYIERCCSCCERCKNNGAFCTRLIKDRSFYEYLFEVI